MVILHSPQPGREKRETQGCLPRTLTEKLINNLRDQNYNFSARMECDIRTLISLNRAKHKNTFCNIELVQDKALQFTEVTCSLCCVTSLCYLKVHFHPVAAASVTQV